MHRKVCANKGNDLWTRIKKFVRLQIFRFLSEYLTPVQV